jgi:hypothetical protein
MGVLDGQVVPVTGAARGQGRSHAVRFAEEDADVIAVDLCAQVGTVPYPLATPDDLAETVKLVEALDRRAAAFEADVRDAAALRAAADTGVGVVPEVFIELLRSPEIQLKVGILVLQLGQFPSQLHRPRAGRGDDDQPVCVKGPRALGELLHGLAQEARGKGLHVLALDDRITSIRLATCQVDPMLRLAFNPVPSKLDATKSEDVLRDG